MENASPHQRLVGRYLDGQVVAIIRTESTSIVPAGVLLDEPDVPLPLVPPPAGRLLLDDDELELSLPVTSTW